jgi:hypothetical protein
MASLRGKLAALVGATVIFGTVVLAGGAAMAQTGGYPPGTSVPPPCTSGNINAGNVSVGQTVKFTLCGEFTDGSSVDVVVNGKDVGTKTPLDGSVQVVIEVISPTVLQVDDPVSATAVCGSNTAVATGPGTPGTATGTFNLVCTSTTTSTTVGATTSTTKATGALAFTGARILEALLIAAALIVVGAVLVLMQRRRRQSF